LREVSAKQVQTFQSVESAMDEEEKIRGDIVEVELKRHNVGKDIHVVGK
jgi:hypothetical protein